jgi:hypothetical protein
MANCPASRVSARGHPGSTGSKGTWRLERACSRRRWCGCMSARSAMVARHHSVRDERISAPHAPSCKPAPARRPLLAASQASLPHPARALLHRPPQRSAPLDPGSVRPFRRRSRARCGSGFAQVVVAQLPRSGASDDHTARTPASSRRRGPTRRPAQCGTLCLHRPIPARATRGRLRGYPRPPRAREGQRCTRFAVRSVGDCAAPLQWTSGAPGTR